MRVATMKYVRMTFPWISAIALSTACSLRPAPVLVSGPENEIQTLVGQWTGEYQSAETGRSGSILFTLEAGTDTAHGDVVMVAREPGMTHDDVMRVMTMRQSAQQVLTIRFVRVNGTTVSGTIDPYPDPDSECELLTVFRGTMKGNRISGTFRTTHFGHESPAQEGTWWVTRAK
jgi:hypothetical protein